MTEEERIVRENALRARIVEAEELRVTSMEKMVADGDVKLADAYVAYCTRYIAALEATLMPVIGPFSTPGLQPK